MGVSSLHPQITKQKDGIWIIDAEGNTLYANQRMAELLGTTVGALKGQSSFAYVFPEDLPAAQRLFESKKDGDTNPFRFDLRRNDGSRIGVIVQGTPMRDHAGAFVGIVGTFTESAEQ